MYVLRQMYFIKMKLSEIPDSFIFIFALAFLSLQAILSYPFNYLQRIAAKFADSRPVLSFNHVGREKV